MQSLCDDMVELSEVRRADVSLENFSVAVDYQCCRRELNIAERMCDAAVVERKHKRQLSRVRVVHCVFSRCVTHRDGDEFEPCGMELPVRIFELGHLFDTTRTVRVPEVNQKDAPFQIGGGRYLLPGEQGKSRVGYFRLRQQKMSRENRNRRTDQNREQPQCSAFQFRSPFIHRYVKRKRPRGPCQIRMYFAPRYDSVYDSMRRDLPA